MKNVMTWGSFYKNGVSSLIRINSTMTAQKYNSIISDTMIPFDEDFFQSMLR